MPSALRHLLGAAVGLLAAPVAFYLTEAGARALRAAIAGFVPGWGGLAWLSGVAVLGAALACWPGLSPLAAACCGVPLAAVGALFATEPEVAAGLARGLPYPPILPDPGEPAGAVAGLTGLYVLLGGLLTVSAVRLWWRRES
ncbi:hypothetical protein ACIBH1_10275 [Nonomuraea sp. NPDC050663]|uniref:hypothetical protein n=1 Tax=Nonomuraea sp. NPDC050663 TaxID=3364370 RepID=UPI0037BDB1D3